jgi:RNA polymerase subunit RPABC4/transcription elongation factor Spt4
MEQVCQCGRTFVSNGSSLCPICIAESMTKKNIKLVTKEEYAKAIEVFHHDHPKTDQLFRELKLQ